MDEWLDGWADVGLDGDGRTGGGVLDVENTLFANDRFAADLGARQRQALDAAERKRFLAVTRVLAQTERGLDAAAHAGSAKQEA